MKTEDILNAFTMSEGWFTQVDPVEGGDYITITWGSKWHANVQIAHSESEGTVVMFAVQGAGGIFVGPETTLRFTENTPNTIKENVSNWRMLWENLEKESAANAAVVETTSTEEQ